MHTETRGATPLYIQIREQLRHDVLSGKIPEGQRFSSISDMAADFNVTAATVRRALQDLTAEGLVSSHVGRGTFVVQRPVSQTASPPHSETASETERSVRRKTTQHTTKDAITDLLALARKDGVISFTRGIGDPDTVEKGTLTTLVHKALASGEELFLDYGDPRGLLPLRQAIAALYTEQGLNVSTDQILVTSGSQQAISLLAQYAAERNMPVLCETPCYSGVSNALSAFVPEIRAVIRTEEGPSIQDIEKALQDSTGRATPQSAEALLYLCPILHNPMGTDISAANQQRIADWAASGKALIISDEIFRDLHSGSNPPQSFLHHPGPEHCAILGSLSKSFISGLRVGWIVSSEERIRALTKLKKALDLGCPPLMQGIARAFLEDADGYSAHRQRIRAHYRVLRDCTLSALHAEMPQGVSWTKPQGGFQLWLTLPPGCSSVQLFVRAVEEGVAFLPGPLQDLDGGFLNSLRLCYGSLSTLEIETGIKRLAKAIRDMLSSPAEPDGAAQIYM